MTDLLTKLEARVKACSGDWKSLAKKTAAKKTDLKVASRFQPTALNS